MADRRRLIPTPARGRVSPQRRKSRQRPFLVAIVGGSGAGKTWLATRLQSAFRSNSILLSLDDFYRDRSHLPPQRRSRLNFDRPSAIDWDCFEAVLRASRTARIMRVPRYDFSTHCRRADWKTMRSKPIVLVEGLWLVHRRRLRRLFDWCVFLDAPPPVRLRRRLARDLAARGRTRASVLEQFNRTVQPMHECFVAPQSRWADVVLNGHIRREEIEALVNSLRKVIASQARARPHARR